MDIAILCEYATVSGGEQSMLATLDGVRRAGFNIFVLGAAEGPLAQRLVERGIKVVPFAISDPAGRHRPTAELREELARLLTRRRPALLHANSLSMGRLSGPVARELCLPSLAHLRDIVRLSRQAVADINCHRRLLAVSRATRDFHVAGGLAAERTFVLHNGVDLKRFEPRSRTGCLHRELGLSLDCHLIGTIGQIGLRKGLDTLAQAAVLVGPRTPEVHYLILGERWSDKAESRQFEAALREVARRDLAGRMHFLGYRGDVDRLLPELTLLVHPARQEPLGRVLLEAAACGTAIVATDVGGTPEIFPPESQAARLVRPDDVQRLAQAIQDLLGDEACRAAMGAAARRRAVAAFDAEQAATGLVSHYREVLDARSGRS
jgi:glycosyltransferase involved in cell wall biosynthesis